jgi:hypothetical protein
LAVFQTRPGIVEQSVGVTPPSPPEEPELLVDPELEPELEDVEPEEVDEVEPEDDDEVDPLPDELLVEPPVLLPDPELELLLPELELLLVDPELVPEVAPEELDPPDEPEPDPPPVPRAVEVEPPHAPTALSGSETARHMNRKRACMGVLLPEPRGPTPSSCHRGIPAFFRLRRRYSNRVARHRPWVGTSSRNTFLTCSDHG